MDLDLMRNFAIAMVALVNPLSRVPLYVEPSTGGRRMASAGGVSGLGGGIVILLVGLGMVRGSAVEITPEEEVQDGGSGAEDIACLLAMADGQWINMLWCLPLGVLGGSVGEEIYKRGFLITSLRDLLGGGQGRLEGYAIEAGYVLVSASVGAGMNVNALVYRRP